VVDHRNERWNYFNYFTKLKNISGEARAHLLVSPLDWAIMEAWHKAGVPLEAGEGIDKAFESYQRSRRGGAKVLKSLAYCRMRCWRQRRAQEAAQVAGREWTRGGGRNIFRGKN